MKTPEHLEEVIKQLSGFPGIGKRSARRMAFWLMDSPAEVSQKLGDALGSLREKVQPCKQCGYYSQGELCAVCADPAREHELICVVEKASDVEAFERTGLFRGLYHVLGGCLSPLDGIGPEELGIQSLLDRLDKTQEIILATGTSAEGESTALYIERLLSGQDIKISRLARGIPVGTDLEYLDDLTIHRALENRSSQ